MHLAAIRTPGHHQNEIVFSNNTTVTYNVLEAAYALRISKLVVASSIAALGCAYAFLYPGRLIPLHYFPIDEAHPLSPIDPYGLSKYVDELTCASFALRSNLSIIALRFPWITCLNDYQNIVRGAVHCERFKGIFWSYIDLSDAAQAIKNALDSKVDGFQPMYVAASDTLCSERSIDLARHFFPSVSEIHFDAGEYRSFFCTNLAARLIGFSPSYTWRKFL